MKKKLDDEFKKLDLSDAQALSKENRTLLDDIVDFCKMTGIEVILP